MVFLITRSLALKLSEQSIGLGLYKSHLHKRDVNRYIKKSNLLYSNDANHTESPHPMEKNWTRRESYRAQAHPHHAEAIEYINVTLISKLIYGLSQGWSELQLRFKRSHRFQGSGQILVHEMDKNLSSDQNKGNASMLVLAVLFGDDAARCGC